MKKITIFRQWCQNGVMEQAIALNLLKTLRKESHCYHHVL